MTVPKLAGLILGGGLLLAAVVALVLAGTGRFSASGRDSQAEPLPIETLAPEQNSSPTQPPPPSADPSGEPTASPPGLQTATFALG